MLPIGRQTLRESPCLMSGVTLRMPTSSDDSAHTAHLDIIIPVYNEGANILRTLQSIMRDVKTPLRVLICYDREDDDTLPVIESNRGTLGAATITLVRNKGRGVHGAVLTGFTASSSPYVVVLPA